MKKIAIAASILLTICLSCRKESDGDYVWYGYGNVDTIKNIEWYTPDRKLQIAADNPSNLSQFIFFTPSTPTQPQGRETVLHLEFADHGRFKLKYLFPGTPFLDTTNIIYESGQLIAYTINKQLIGRTIIEIEDTLTKRLSTQILLANEPRFLLSLPITKEEAHLRPPAKELAKVFNELLQSQNLKYDIHY